MSTSTSVDQIDVRGPRFVAWVTTAVLVVTFVVATFSTVGAAVVIGLQGVAFAIGAALGPHKGPYGRIYKAVVAPRLSPVTEKEPIPPLRFAQGLGFVFALGAFLGFALGAPVVGAIFTGFALFAAFLNAAFGICLGCMIYPLVARLRTPATA